MDLQVHRDDNGVTSIFRVEGEFRAFAASFSLLQRMVTEALDEGQTNMVLDMGNVNYADSSALGNLVGIHMDVKKAGGQFMLCNLHPEVSSIVEKANLARYFQIFENVDQSLEVLSN
jgi:anti-anti-sigma factor